MRWNRKIKYGYTLTVFVVFVIIGWQATIIFIITAALGFGIYHRFTIVLATRADYPSIDKLFWKTCDIEIRNNIVCNVHPNPRGEYILVSRYRKNKTIEELLDSIAFLYNCPKHIYYKIRLNKTHISLERIHLPIKECAILDDLMEIDAK